MKINIKESISDFFKTEKWVNTLLFGALSCLIPIVGPMVLEGYFTRRLARTREGLPIKDFEFNDFEAYLKLGLWPFLVSMVISLVALPFMFLIYIPMVMAMLSESTGLMIGVGVAVTIGVLLVTLAMLIITAPCFLRAALTSNFKEGFKWSFIVDFLKRVGGALTVAMILFGLVSIALSILGMMACGIGLYVVIPIIYFGYLHIMFQAYALYLERGGEEINLHPDVLGQELPPTPPPAVPSI